MLDKEATHVNSARYNTLSGYTSPLRKRTPSDTKKNTRIQWGDVPTTIELCKLIYKDSKQGEICSGSGSGWIRKFLLDSDPELLF